MTVLVPKTENGVSQMELTATKELITKLKAVKREYELTIPRIQEMMEKNGDFVSLSTLRRIFSEGSEEMSFSYDRSLAPVARALLFQDAGSDPESDAATDDRVEGLKAVILLKNEELARLQELNEHLEDRVAFLLGQIEKKDRRMDEKDEMIRKLMDKVL